MNDVLATIMIALAVDFCTFDSEHDDVYRRIHSPEIFWSEAYAMYSAIMNLGVKGTYYGEDPGAESIPTIQTNAS